VRKNQILLPTWYYFAALILLAFVFFPPTRHFFAHSGRRWLYILVLAFSVSGLTTPICRIFAMNWGLVVFFLVFFCHFSSMASSIWSLEPFCLQP
jgi:hypothetical protein